MLDAQRRKALVVDDDWAVRDTLQIMLIHCGLDVILSSTVAEARQWLHTSEVQIVLMDALLPGDRLSLAKEIDARDIPLLLMSGDPEARWTYAELWRVNFLAKPFNLSGLSTAISQALAGQASQEAGAAPPQGKTPR